MEDEDCDFISKIVLVGDSGVGKSNILLRYTNNEFILESKATVGIEFASKKINVGNSSIKAQIWDTAGQERFKSLTNLYYKGATGAIVVYDITRESSFENVDKWITELKNIADPDISILLVGNKSDLNDLRVVKIDQGEQKAKIHSIYF